MVEKQTMNSTHHISKLEYRVRCSSEEHAFALRELLSAMGTDALMEELEVICQEFVSEDELIRIPKLEVPLGTSTLPGLINSLRAQFGAKLQSGIHQYRLSGSPESVPYAGKLKLDALCYFLETGLRPHWAAILSEQPDELAGAVLDQQKDSFAQFLKSQYASPVVWRRIDAQFSLQLKEQFLRLVPELEAAYIRLQQHNVAPTPDSTGHQTLLSEAPYELYLSAVLQNATAIFRNASLIPAIVDHIQAIKDQGISSSFMSTLLQLPIDKGNRDPAVLLEVQGQDLPSIQLDTAKEKLPIRNAGIVLLHPFLKPFFTELQLMRDGSWVDRQAQQRAVLLLHFLGSGKEAAAEWELVLEKLLCGLPLAVPCDRSLVLQEQEQVECRQLLTAIIQHWAALKNTSIAALQEGFFKRDGLLEPTEQGWRLRIERKTQDVLLEAIPWTYSMIRFSWNDYLMEVVW